MYPIWLKIARLPFVWKIGVCNVLRKER